MVIDSILSEEPQPPEKYDPDIPEGLIHFIGKLLSKLPETRLQSMTEISSALQDVFVPQPKTSAGQEIIEEWPPSVASSENVVLEESDTHSFLKTAPGTVVGRTAELAFLHKRFDQSLKGARQVVFCHR